MNLLLLLLGVRPWRAPSSTAAFTRVFVALSLFSIEAQVATLAGGAISWLVAINLVVAVLLTRVPWPDPTPPGRVAPLAVAPLAAVVAAATLVAALNLLRPLVAADPYHLDKVDYIRQTDSLHYDPSRTLKINVLNSVYELFLADLAEAPVVGSTLVRLHGLLGFLLYLLALASTRELLGHGGPAPPARSTTSWPWVFLLVVPVVFHQWILVKNDLLIGTLTLVVLTWVLTRADTATRGEVAWSCWLTGFAVSLKLTALPLVVLVVSSLALRHRRRWTLVPAVVGGGVAGAVCGGFLFGVFESLRVYGAPLPTENIGGWTEGIAGIAIGVPRLTISLVDLGQLTPLWWPGRGGWGSTFGLPLIWAIVALIVLGRDLPLVRRAALLASLHFVMFASAFVDADIAQRLALGPGLLLIVLAVDVVEQRASSLRWLRAAQTGAIALSAAQIARSAWLYWRL